VDDPAAMKHYRRQYGFVLVLVLMVLAVCASTMAIAARRSGARAIAASEALQSLQVRWGTESCRKTCMPMAERMLRLAVRPGEEPPVVVRHSLRLGSMQFNILASDEQAKADVNALARRQKMAGVENLLRTVQTGNRFILVRLRPSALAPNVIGSVPMQFSSYDQLYDVDHPSILADPNGELPPAVRRVTCWSGGRLNLARAESIVIEQALAGLLTYTQVSRLEILRKARPQASLETMLKEMELTKEQEAALAPWVTTTSTCHSLWVMASNGRRNFYRLDVDQTGDAQNHGQHWSFSW
jgi:hypothetical protein